jgi:hypothetical protein
MLEPLVIDDLDPALAGVPDACASVLRRAGAIVREAVLEFSTRRGWPIIVHSAFSTWARELMGRDSRRWIVLDPLVPIGSAEAGYSHLRVTREVRETTTVANAAKLSVSPVDLSGLNAGRGEIGLLDDAAGSGRTLIEIARLLAQRGLTVDRVALCAASSVARRNVEHSISRSSWKSFVEGDWLVAHMRDGCPFFPRSGRAIQPNAGAPSAVRAAVADIPGHPWQALASIRAVRDAIQEAQTVVVGDLERRLGRVACVADLSLLGTATAAVRDWAQIQPSTPLAELVFGAALARRA